jgi:hypothetical protein
LQELEQIIQRGLETFVEVGTQMGSHEISFNIDLSQPVRTRADFTYRITTTVISMDFIGHWSERTEIGALQLVAWIGLSRSKYYCWRDRYGQANEHNALVPRDH